MVRIPSSTIRQAAAPSALDSGDEAVEQQDGEVVELDAEEGETVSVVVPAGVMAHASEAIAAGAPNSPSSATSGAGVASPPVEPAPVTATSTEAPPAQSPVEPTPADDRIAFKVVLALKPADEGRWHATIAVGRDGCDPVFEPADVADWPEALDAVLGVQAAAEARWAEQPRNATAPIKIGGVKPETTASGSPAQDGGRRGNGKANQPTNDTDRGARRRQGKSAAPASVGKVAATVVDGGVEKLSLF